MSTKDFEGLGALGGSANCAGCPWRAHMQAQEDFLDFAQMPESPQVADTVNMAKSALELAQQVVDEDTTSDPEQLAERRSRIGGTMADLVANQLEATMTDLTAESTVYLANMTPCPGPKTERRFKVPGTNLRVGRQVVRCCNPSAPWDDQITATSYVPGRKKSWFPAIDL